MGRRWRCGRASSDRCLACWRCRLASNSHHPILRRTGHKSLEFSARMWLGCAQLRPARQCCRHSTTDEGGGLAQKRARAPAVCALLLLEQPNAHLVGRSHAGCSPWLLGRWPTSACSVCARRVPGCSTQSSPVRLCGYRRARCCIAAPQPSQHPVVALFVESAILLRPSLVQGAPAC